MGRTKPMDSLYQLLGSVLVGLIFLGVMSYLNSRRDVFFRELARQYGLQFEKPALPARFQAKMEFPIRRLCGRLEADVIIIEDVICSYRSGPFLFGAIAKSLPLPLFGNTGIAGVRVHTNFFINEIRQEPYLVNANFVASRSKMETFLKQISQ